jgi:hypothetical protein
MTAHPILAPMRAAILSTSPGTIQPAPPRSYRPDVERRAGSGIRPGGEPQATDPHLRWVDLSSWKFSVCPSMYAAQGSGTSLSSAKESRYWDWH